jgi:hypothetical protein
MKKTISILLVLVLALCASIPAFAADTITTGGGSATKDVKATYQPGDTPTIYSVDITWGSMEFTYTDASKGTWDPETHQYKGATEATWSCENDANKITVTNHSNAGIKAVLGYTSGEGFSEINGNFSKDSYTLRSAEGTTRGNAPSYDFYLTLSGSLNESALENTVIGTVTITIHGFDSLTD